MGEPKPMSLSPCSLAHVPRPLPFPCPILFRMRGRHGAYTQFGDDVGNLGGSLACNECLSCSNMQESSFGAFVARQHKRWKESALVKAERENFGQVY
jgi:hypothetical protein